MQHRALTAVVLLASLLAVGVSPLRAGAALQPGGTFIDDNGSTFEPAIEAVAAEGITAGCGGGRFCPATRSRGARWPCSSSAPWT